MLYMSVGMVKCKPYMVKFSDIVRAAFQDACREDFYNFVVVMVN